MRSRPESVIASRSSPRPGRLRQALWMTAPLVHRSSRGRPQPEPAQQPCHMRTNKPTPTEQHAGPLRRRRRRFPVSRCLLSLFCMVLIGLGAPFVLPASADRSFRIPAPRAAGAYVRYRAPLVGRIVVLRPFEPPPSPYGAGHRGVDLAASRGTVVVAAASGRVSFAGQVAGRGVVVVTHADGVRTEYEPVRPLVAAGQQMSAGQPIGLLRGTHDQCAPDRCMHWGARRGDLYIDPMLLLRPLGPVRLLPWPAIGAVLAIERSSLEQGAEAVRADRDCQASSTVRHDGTAVADVRRQRAGPVSRKQDRTPVRAAPLDQQEQSPQKCRPSSVEPRTARVRAPRKCTPGRSGSATVQVALATTPAGTRPTIQVVLHDHRRQRHSRDNPGCSSRRPAGSDVAPAAGLRQLVSADARPAPTHVDALGSTPATVVRRKRACRSAWWPGSRGRVAPVPRADLLRRRAGGLQRYA